MNAAMIMNPMTAIRLAQKRLEKAYVLAHNVEDNTRTETQVLESIAILNRAIFLLRREEISSDDPAVLPKG